MLPDYCRKVRTSKLATMHCWLCVLVYVLCLPAVKLSWEKEVTASAFYKLWSWSSLMSSGNTSYITFLQYFTGKLQRRRGKEIGCSECPTSVPHTFCIVHPLHTTVITENQVRLNFHLKNTWRWQAPTTPTTAQPTLSLLVGVSWTHYYY